MTVKELKELLNKYPEDARFEIVMWEGHAEPTESSFSCYTVTNFTVPVQYEVVELDLTQVRPE